MRVVVSGTHASGKSTLVADLALALRGYEQLPDPFELVDVDDPSGAGSFVAQLHVAAERLLALAPGADVVAERGPLDLLAYLAALADLGRPGVTPRAWGELVDVTAGAMAHVDLLVVLPLDPGDGILVPSEEDPDLRDAMDVRLLELLDDPDLVPATTRVLELSGSPEQRLSRLLTAIAHPESSP